jgi:7-keto-8-aminopelargonate synthetase-like enzyme
MILEGGVSNFICIDHTSYSYFAGNNYLGLANNPEITQASVKALQTYGLNLAASRKTTGTSNLHIELERRLASFKEREDAVTFASGYLGNKILLETLSERYNTVLIDSMAHSSLLEGIPKAKVKIDFFNHRDSLHLATLLKNLSPGDSPIILTDGIFALTGEIAPLDQYYELALKYNALILVDDAHATGILGEKGKGTPEYFHLDEAPNIFQSETMSKALGAYGGFLAGNHDFIQSIRDKSSFFSASTALPPPIVGGAVAALKLMVKHPDIRAKLQENLRRLKEGIINMGLKTNNVPTPIIPVFFESKEQALSLSHYLEQHCIIAPFVSYPVKTEEYLVRITVSASHTFNQIEELLETIKEWIVEFNSPLDF